MNFTHPFDGHRNHHNLGELHCFCISGNIRYSRLGMEGRGLMPLYFFNYSDIERSTENMGWDTEDRTGGEEGKGEKGGDGRA